MSILSPYSVIWVLAVTWKIFLKQNRNPYTLSNWCSATHYLWTYQTILKKKKNRKARKSKNSLDGLILTIYTARRPDPQADCASL